MWHRQEQNIYVEWICDKEVMGQNKITCIIITESIGKTDQEVLFWGHFYMDSFIILCKTKPEYLSVIKCGSCPV